LRNEAISRTASSAGLPPGTALTPAFFDRDAQAVACDLLGKVLCHVADGMACWAAIVEAEAYYLDEKASHASLGYTDKRRALFMPPGTIYMYYARGGDSFNVSCAGAGNAVLVKAGCVPGSATVAGNAVDSDVTAMLACMQARNPLPSGKPRPAGRLCSGQTLLCRALGLRVPEWDGVAIGTPPLTLLDVGYRPRTVLRTTRLGIPPGRDGHLPYRFVDGERAAHATEHPLRRTRHGRNACWTIHLPAGAGTPDWAALLAPPEAAARA
jgi:DNA-3-methyladenine glycosylase